MKNVGRLSTLDMASIPRLSRWAVVDSNIVILARTTDYCATKLLRIVAVDFAHFPQQGHSACRPTSASHCSLGNTACEIASPAVKALGFSR